jgi:hypothetical protein
MKSWSLALASLALGLLLASCSSKFSYVGTECDVHYDAEADQLVVLEIEHGIYVGTTDKVGDALRTLDRAASGARVIPPDEGFIHVDLDACEEKLRTGGSRPATAAELRAANYFPNIKVTQSGLFLDDAGQLSLYRMWTLSNFKAAIEVVNDTINATLTEHAGEPAAFVPNFPVYDEATRDLQSARAKSGAAWLSIDKSALVLDLPMTRNSAARALAQLIENPSGPQVSGCAPILAHLSSLEIKDDRAILRFDFAVEPWMHFESWGDRGKYGPILLNALDRNEMRIDETASEKRLREKIGAPAPVRPK